MADAVTVRFYAPLSDLVGGKEVVLPLAEPLPVVDFLVRLQEAYPALRPFLAGGGSGGEEPILVVVNGRLAFPEDALRPGDEVFLSPQISGGR